MSGKKTGRPVTLVYEHGQQVGILTVLEETKTPAGRRAHRCQCACGTELVIETYNLKRVRSCGCRGKRCSRCGNPRALRDFKVGPGLHGRSVWCRSCCSDVYQEHLAEDPQFARRQFLWSRYHMTLEDYEIKLASQGYACAMCRKFFSLMKELPHVDHDHNCCSGKITCGNCVRDILCGSCNRLVGIVEGVRGRCAIAYVRKWAGVI